MNRPLRDGFSLVWRHQRLVWWIFVVNLFLGFFAFLGPHLGLHSFLDKSMYSRQLSQRFDAAVFLELLGRPDISLSPAIAGSAVLSIVFFFYVLFLSGGILSAYTYDRKLTNNDFFGACGRFFWRMLRLLLCSLIPFAIAFAAFARVQTVSGRMAADAAWELQGFWVQVIGSLICLLFLLFIRAWFDLAQARTIRDDVRVMFFLTWRSFILAARNAPRLVFIYFTITIVGAVLAVGAWFLWLNIQHSSFGASWFLLELCSLIMVGLRLWQRGATVLWYENYAELHPAFVAVPPAPLSHDLDVPNPEQVDLPSADVV